MEKDLKDPGYVLYKHLMEGTKLPEPPIVFDEEVNISTTLSPQLELTDT
jgi:hypothetical protein